MDFWTVSRKRNHNTLWSKLATLLLKTSFANTVCHADLCHDTEHLLKVFSLHKRRKRYMQSGFQSHYRAGSFNVCSEQLLKLAANNFHSLLTGFSEKRKKANTHNTLNNNMTEWCLQILWILQTVHRLSSLSVSIGWVNVLVLLEWILVGIVNRMLIHSNCKWNPKTAVHLHLPA